MKKEHVKKAQSALLGEIVEKINRVVYKALK